MDWVWIDTNTKLPLDEKNIPILNRCKKCLVCPERWGRPLDIKMYKKTAIIVCLFSMIFAQDNVELEEDRHFNSYQINLDRFKQLNEDITTPNTYRTAAGYPGHEYWQVRMALPESSWNVDSDVKGNLLERVSIAFLERLKQLGSSSVINLNKNSFKIK